MAESGIKLTLVGDSRQATFSTHNSIKNKKFKGINILAYFQALAKAEVINLCEMNECYRSNQDICTFADMAFPKLAKATSLMESKTPHDGIFLVKKEDSDAYICWMINQKMKYQCLKYDKNTKTSYETFNFGECKGMTFDRVVIFSNKPLEEYLTAFKLKSPAKYYVGLTRARYSVAIIVEKFPVCDCYEQETLDGITVLKFIANR